MIISYLGHSCFKIQDKLGVEGKTITTDPFDKVVGLKVPNFESDIVTVSYDYGSYNNTKVLRGDPFVIDSSGEYEISGIMVQGISSKHDDKKGAERGENILYRIELDGITVAHLGSLGYVLTDEQLEQLEGVDILLVPVGGKHAFDYKKAVEVVSQIEPRIVIPMQYNVKGLKIDIDDETKFIKELGIEPTREDKLKINKKDLPQEGMELVILNPFN